MDHDRKICVGMIAGPHGVRGLVRLRSFTEDPETIIDYDPLTDETGERIFAIELKSAAKDFFVAEIAGVATREAAEALRSTKLFVARSQLPKTGKREYYEADLIGLAVKDKQDQSHGAVQGVHNYGAGTFIEVGVKKGSGIMLPFTDAFVPNVDMKAGLVTIDPPEGWMDSNKPEKKPKPPKKGQGAEA